MSALGIVMRLLLTLGRSIGDITQKLVMATGRLAVLIFKATTESIQVLKSAKQDVTGPKKRKKRNSFKKQASERTTRASPNTAKGTYNGGNVFRLLNDRWPPDLHRATKTELSKLIGISPHEIYEVLSMRGHLPKFGYYYRKDLFEL